MSSAGHAAPPADSEPYPHPLLTVEGRAVVDDLAAALGTNNPASLLEHLSVGGSIIDDEHGWRVDEWVAPFQVVQGAHSYEQRVAPPRSGASVSPLLEAALTAAAPSETVAAELCLRRMDWKPVVSVWHEMDLALVRGDVSTWGDVRDVIDDTRQRVRDAGRAAVGAFLASHPGAGVEVEHVTAVSGCMKLSAPASALRAMLADPALTSADVADPPIEEDAGYAWTVDGPTVDGYELEDLIQSTQFYDDGYSGDERIGIIDAKTLHRKHVGFDDASGTDRVENCGAPDPGGTCTDNPDSDPGAAHGTATASIVLGDLTAGQDSNYSDDQERRERSGVARGATGLGIGPLDDWTAILPTAGDIQLTVRPGGLPPDNDCLGNDPQSVDINAMFEDGVFMVWSAGNNGHDQQPPVCRVRVGQSAIGAFVAGAYRVDASDNEVIYGGSARGGGGCGDCDEDMDDNNDDTRTIVDIMAPSGLYHPYPHYDTTTCNPPFDYRADWGSDCTDESFCCTSAATAVTGGAAALFREWWLDDIGSAILNKPERLFTQLLLMGDRQGETAVLTEGFDELWGAGKLRLRKYDDDGMDDPALLKWDNFCVDHNADVIANLPSAWSPMPTAVDMMKVVAFWYDSRHDSGTEHDKIDLAVEWNDNGTWTEAASSTTDDNRQRVYISDPNQAEYRVVFTGRDVTTDVQGCGQDSMKVWAALFVEDSARDDGISNDEPHYVRPE